MSGINPSMSNEERLEGLWYVDLNDYIIGLAWSPDAAKLAVVTVEGSVYLIDDHGDSAQTKLVGQHAGGANSLSWRFDSAEFATSGHDGLVKVWNGSSGYELDQLEGGDSWVSKAVYNPRRKLLASGAGKYLKIWNETRELVYESSDHSSTIADIGWNPDGSGVAVAAYNGITLHVPGKQKRPRKYLWKGSSLVLAWSPDSKYIATGEQDMTVHFWHVKSGKDAQMAGFPYKALQLSWDASGRWLATGGSELVCLWDCSGDGPEGRKPRQLQSHNTKLAKLSFQPDGTYLASADNDSTLLLWDPFTYDQIIGGVILSASASCLEWSKDARLAVGQENGTVVVFKVQP